MLSVSLHFCCNLGPPFVVAMPALFCHMNRQVRLHLRCQLVIFYASSLHHFYSLVARVFLYWAASSTEVCYKYKNTPLLSCFNIQIEVLVLVLKTS